MPDSHAPAKPRGLALMLGRRRIGFVLKLATVPGVLLGVMWDSGLPAALIRAWLLGLLGLLVFGVFEQWPRHLPKRLARWVLQVVAVALAMPLGSAALYVLTTHAGAPPFWAVADRLEGFATMCVLGLLTAPWGALGALVRQKEALAHDQALEFQLERSELERQAVTARLHLLQAQLAPHFLFNTLANVQALVDAGSPRAPAVLRSLIAYLHASVPQLNAAETTVRRELELVKAYLELMHMRIPDRLQFTVDADPEALDLPCPPLTLMTLVENAVRHGIDPSEDGGRIDVVVQRRGSRCHVRISDTGVGLQAGGGGLGTGLSTLRERLALSFGDEASLRVIEQSPRGVYAELELPVPR